MNVNQYTDDLALELRLLDVPGDRIGQILAEVEAHVADTDEDPVDAFGDAREYARQFAGPDAPRDVDSDNFFIRFFGSFRAKEWLMLICGTVGTFLGITFLLSGVFAMLQPDRPAIFGLPVWAAIAIGLALLASWGVWFLRIPKDPIVDPRSGKPVDWDLKGRRRS